LSGNLDEVKKLIQIKANVCAYNNLAQQYALYNDHIEIAKLLVQNGVNIHNITPCSLQNKINMKINNIDSRSTRNENNQPILNGKTNEIKQ